MAIRSEEIFEATRKAIAADKQARDAFAVEPSPYRRLPPKTLEERVFDLEATLDRRLEEDNERSKRFFTTAARTLKLSMFLLVLSSLLQLGIGIWEATK